jgi:hypothetical protein
MPTPQELMDGPYLGVGMRKGKAIPGARRSSALPRGHAAPIGTGPAGETCGGCRHAHRMEGSSKHWIKCELMRAIWTGGTATDIRAGDAACRQWERPE